MSLPIFVRQCQSNYTLSREMKLDYASFSSFFPHYATLYIYISAAVSAYVYRYIL